MDLRSYYGPGLGELWLLSFPKLAATTHFFAASLSVTLNTRHMHRASSRWMPFVCCKVERDKKDLKLNHKWHNFNKRGWQMFLIATGDLNY